MESLNYYRTVGQCESAWNIHGLGDKINDDEFREKINSEINILLETWTGSNKNYELPDFLTISKCRKKKKKSRRHSGGIIVYYKKSISHGIQYLENGSKSENSLWIKLDKSVFSFDQDIYICAVYIPPVTSTHYNSDYVELENEITLFSMKGKILLIGDFNSRTGTSPDYITNDSDDLNNFNNENLLPDNYSVDTDLNRHNQDNICNDQGRNLLDLCIASKLRILNGRYVGDSLGYFTCLTVNGLSTVDYGVLSESLLPSVLYFTNQEFNYLSDHAQIQVIIKCELKYKDKYPSLISEWSKTKSYKWNDLSKNKLLECLSDEELLNNIVNFESKNFSEDQSGVNLASEELNSLLTNIANKSCKVTCTKNSNKKNKKVKQKWSDLTIYDQKKSINLLCNKIRKNPYNRELKQKDLCQLKIFRKIVKQKKSHICNQYMTNFRTL